MELLFHGGPAKVNGCEHGRRASELVGGSSKRPLDRRLTARFNVS